MFKESYPIPSSPSPLNSRSSTNSAFANSGRAAKKAVEPSSTHNDRFIGHDVSDIDNKPVTSQPVRKRNKLLSFFRSPSSKPKAKSLPSSSPKVSVNRLSTSGTTETLHIISTASTQHTSGIENVTSGTVKIEYDFSSTAAKSPSSDVFPLNVNKPTIAIPLPEFGERIDATPQLALCIGLLLKDSDALDHKEDLPLQVMSSSTAARLAWLKSMRQDPTEQERLHWLANRMVDKFVNDASKDSTEIAEMVLLGPVLDNEHYRRLLSCTITAFDQNALLDVDLLQGLVQLIQSGRRGSLISDDLVKILSILRVRLQGTHQQSSEHPFHLTLAVSRLLDVLAEHKVQGLDRVVEHEPLSEVLSCLKGNSDPYLMYQACYAFQALQYVPSNETPLQAVLRHSTGVVDGLVKVSAVFNLDLAAVLEGLGNLQEALGSAIGTAVTVYEGVNSLMGSGRGVMDSLKEGYAAGKKHPWYAAIRAAQTFVQSGQLKDLNVLIFEAPCRCEPLFQWGICQLLGEIASDDIWATPVRQQAVDLLGYLNKNDSEWGQDENVKTWMLNIMHQLTTITDQAVSSRAQTLLKNLHQDQGTTSQLPYPLRNRLPLPTYSPILARVLNIPPLDYDLYQFKVLRLKQSHLAVYIPPLAKPGLKATDEELFSLMEKVQEFLASERQVMLILGDSGSGKSTFNRHLEHCLWTDYKQGGHIPLFINLPAIDRSDQDMIAKQLRANNFSDDQIQEMKQHRQLILICDGYDESQQLDNLHRTNMLNQPGQWDTKMIISCRTQFLGPAYVDRFKPQPTDRYAGGLQDLFQEAVIAPFSKEQVKSYVEQYALNPETAPLFRNIPVWSAEEYMEKLTAIPNVMDLVKNPFLLTLALKALPGLVASNKDLASIRVTRVGLYDMFVDQWLETNRLRIQPNKLNQKDLEAYVSLMDDDFIRCGIDYLLRLAAAIFKEQDGNPVVQYIHRQDKDSWKAEFFGNELEARLLREASPLTRTGYQYRFVHRSVLEYLLSCLIYNPAKTDEEVNNPEFDAAPLTSLSFDTNSPLFQRNLLLEPSVIQFLCDRVKSTPDFEHQLRAVIDKSKTDSSAGLAATNAITILVRAGALFNGADLRGVKISGANLSGGQFDHAQFQGADLREVNLAGSWLRKANLSSAQLEGVRFGESPYIEMNDTVHACAYSPDGKMLAVGLDVGGFEIYDTTTWTIIHRCPVKESVNDVAFSPDGRRIVSGCGDSKVRLWDCFTGEEVLAMEGHHRNVSSITFSPCGERVASASHDMTVRVWDSRTGEGIFVLEGHTSYVSSVQYSPDGRQLVSGGRDATIRFWDPETGEPGVVWDSSLGDIYSLAFSGDGRWIASGQYFGGLQLWNAVSREPGLVLRGHAGTVTGVTFSPNSRWLASSSLDETMRIWDTSAGTLVFMSAGHKNWVNDVAFSPSGLQIASGGIDRKVRLWEVDSLLSSSVEAHDPLGAVWKAMYSLNGQAILSFGSAKTVKQWDSMAGAPVQLPIGLLESLSVDAVAYSLNDIPVAICKQAGAIRLLEIQEGGAETVIEGTGTTTSVGMSPSCRFIVSLDWDDTVTLWELGTTQHNQILLENGGSAQENNRFIRFSTTEHQLAVGSSSGIVRVFDSRSGGLVISKEISDQSVTAISFSPNDLQLAIGTEGHSIYLWNLQLEESAIELRGHTGCVRCIAYSPCSQWIASGSEDKTVRLWSRQQPPGETESWSCIHTVHDFFDYVYAVAWSPTVPMEFVTGCRDESVRVWRVSGKGEDVVVKLVWGTNLAVLHAEGLVLKNRTGLSLANRKLLVQRGAIDDSLALEEAGGLEVEE